MTDEMIEKLKKFAALTRCLIKKILRCMITVATMFMAYIQFGVDGGEIQLAREVIMVPMNQRGEDLMMGAL